MDYGMALYGAVEYENKVSATSKCLRIYDRKHNILDEIDNFNNDLQYDWTLDDIGTASFSLGLENKKCTEKNMQFFNHIEVVDENNNKIWGGIIAGLNFDNPALKVNCLDYFALLKWRRLRTKTYPATDYGNLMKQLINDINAIADSGVSIGNIAAGALQTTRDIKNTDFAADKIKEINADTNYDFDVDVNRSFNFYIRKGKDKPDYSLTYGGSADNIIEKPTLSRDVMSMANSVYSEVSKDSTVLTSTAQDSNSINTYGLVEGVYSANNGVTDQSTLDNQANGALQRQAYPIDSFSIKAIDSTLCPFNDIEVGDSVTVNLIPYFNFSALMRIIRMVHDEKTGTRDITFGEIIFRPQPPVKKLYRK